MPDAWATVVFTKSSLPKSDNIKFKQWVAQGDQEMDGNSSSNLLPVATMFEALSVTKWTTCSDPTKFTTSLNNLNKKYVVLELSVASTDLRKTVPLGQYTKKLMRVLLFLSVHPSAIIVQPVSLQVLRKSSVGAESDQHVNICSFAVHCDQMWPSTQ